MGTLSAAVVAVTTVEAHVHCTREDRVSKALIEVETSKARWQEAQSGGRTDGTAWVCLRFTVTWGRKCLEPSLTAVTFRNDFAHTSHTASKQPSIPSTAVGTTLLAASPAPDSPALQQSPNPLPTRTPFIFVLPPTFPTSTPISQTFPPTSSTSTKQQHGQHRLVHDRRAAALHLLRPAERHGARRPVRPVAG